MGVPGWPEFAFWTASIESVRIVFTLSWSSAFASTAVVIWPPRSWLSRCRFSSIPRVLLGGEQPGADPPGVRAPLGQRDAHPLPRRGQGPPGGLLVRPLEEQVGGAREAAPDDEVLGLEDVHVARDARTEVFRE